MEFGRLYGWLLAALVFGSIGAAADDQGKKPKGNLDAIFKKLDSNKDGKLDRDEFLRLADRAKEKDQARAKLSQTYDKLDPEMKGITKDQFRRFLENGKNGGTNSKSAK
jgi:EF hand domain-containing protein